METLNYNDCKQFTNDFLAFAPGKKSILAPAATMAIKEKREPEFVQMLAEQSVIAHDETYRVLGTRLYNRLMKMTNQEQNEFTPKKTNNYAVQILQKEHKLIKAALNGWELDKYPEARKIREQRLQDIENAINLIENH